MMISIITVCYNSEKYIEETILSVISQKGIDVEYIIIDGGSTDDTKEIINKYLNKIACFISEMDNGMYDAINKGISLAKGEIIGILNSDDTLASDHVIYDINEYFLNKSIDGIYGNINIIDQNSNLKKRRRVFQISSNQLKSLQKGFLTPHPTFYLRRNVYENEKYSLEYKYASDFEFILRIFEKYKIVYINKYIVNFRRHNESITGKGYLEAEKNIITDNYKSKNYFVRVSNAIRNAFLISKYLFLNYLINR